MKRTTTCLSVGVVLWAVVVTALRTIRPPNDFAEVHWLLDYRFGLIRRGLAGTVLQWLGLTSAVDGSEAAIQMVTYAIFGALCTALLFVGGRVLHRLDLTPGALALVLVAATSSFVVISSHLMGYLDQPLFVLTVAGAWLVLRDHRWSAAVLGGVGVLVHENCLVTGLPALAFASLAAASDGDRTRKRSAVVHLPLLLPIVVFAVLAVNDSRCTDRYGLQCALTQHLQRYAFVQRGTCECVPAWLMISFEDTVRQQQVNFIDRMANGPILWAVLPAMATLVFGAVTCLPPHRRRWWGAAIGAVACAPLALHLVAWDTARIWSFTIGSAFIALWIVCETNPAPAPPGPGRLVTFACALALLANLLGRIELLDMQEEAFSNAMLLLLSTPMLLGGLAVWATQARRAVAPGVVERPPGT